jgi:hypothetical protein
VRGVKVASCLSFFLSVSTAATYIFTAPTCTANIIHFEPSALNAEFIKSRPMVIVQLKMEDACILCKVIEIF